MQKFLKFTNSLNFSLPPNTSGIANSVFGLLLRLGKGKQQGPACLLQSLGKRKLAVPPGRPRDNGVEDDCPHILHPAHPPKFTSSCCSCHCCSAGEGVSDCAILPPWGLPFPLPQLNPICTMLCVDRKMQGSKKIWRAVPPVAGI